MHNETLAASMERVSEGHVTDPVLPIPTSHVNVHRAGDRAQSPFWHVTAVGSALGSAAGFVVAVFGQSYYSAVCSRGYGAARDEFLV